MTLLLLIYFGLTGVDVEMNARNSTFVLFLLSVVYVVALHGRFRLIRTKFQAFSRSNE